MDTLIFGLLLAVSLLIVFSRRRWTVIVSWAVAVVAVMSLFAMHATDSLDLTF
ncbi:DUF5993 family protein [Microbacterium sp. LRZ72]|uniref:DUF5993 family protein n=1 Tax=Microbacterium sp. LRZ72 TaxID=2942481 RepID=UPI0029BA9386|nr:DUF5993 family protein [Microbacterium sp. LRZ72]MDX2375317.1 DUF5993 family protein [Microbacterium sp. LRZ72]